MLILQPSGVGLSVSQLNKVAAWNKVDWKLLCPVVWTQEVNKAKRGKKAMLSLLRKGRISPPSPFLKAQCTFRVPSGS